MDTSQPHNVKRKWDEVRKIKCRQFTSGVKGKKRHKTNRNRVRLKPDGTRRRTGVKGKLANGVGSQYSHTTSEHGVSSITTADAHTSAVSSQLNWRPLRFKWTRPFQRKTKSGFCACAIAFQTQSTARPRCIQIANGSNKRIGSGAVPNMTVQPRMLRTAYWTGRLFQTLLLCSLCKSKIVWAITSTAGLYLWQSVNSTSGILLHKYSLRKCEMLHSDKTFMN